MNQRGTGPRPLVRGGAVGLGFGSVASSTFASVYRAVPAVATTQATTTLFITVQLAASVGVTVIGLLLDRIDPGVAFRVLFWFLAAAAGGMLVVSRLLPGRPNPAVVRA